MPKKKVIKKVKKSKPVDKEVFIKQISSPRSAVPVVSIDPRDDQLRDALPVVVKKETYSAVFKGAGSIHLTKKDGKRVAVRFEPGVYELKITDEEVADLLRGAGYKEI